MPYTTLVPGTTITSAWANASVRDQVVTPFATAAARTSAISSPVTGMLSYRTDGVVFEGYDGVAWVPVGRFGQLAYKTADEGVSGTSFQDDDHLFVALAANATYRFICQFLYNAPAAGDLKTQFTVPASTTGELKAWAVGSGVAAAADLAAITSTTVFDGSGLGSAAQLFGTVTTAGTAGNMRLQWAQNASSGTTTLYAGSFFEVTRVA